MSSGLQGTIYKGIGGFYYVKVDTGEIIECKPKGLFRKQKITPLAGDRVILAYENDTPFIDEILPRKNTFIRPPVANIDVLVIVASTIEPKPNTMNIDILSVMALSQQVKPIIVLTKTDLASADNLVKNYAQSGIEILLAGEQISQLVEQIKGKFSVFCGNSGVGKSTLLNKIIPESNREVAQISQKLGRGRHTTREVQILGLPQGGIVADTPGFASLDVERLLPIEAQDLQLEFPEIHAYFNKCRFADCVHIKETGCAVREAVQQGTISENRYKNYTELYTTLYTAQQKGK